MTMRRILIRLGAAEFRLLRFICKVYIVGLYTKVSIQYYHISFQSMKVGKSIDNKQDKKPIITRQNEPGDSRRAILQKLQVKRTKNEQGEFYGGGSNTVNSLEKAGNLPHSTKSQDDLRANNQRYFRKDRADSKNIRTNSPHEQKFKTVGDQEDNKNSMGFQKANTQYLKLHDKLNFLESKISQMKNNLQKKKQEKLKKKKQQEEKKAKVQQQKKKKKKSHVALDQFVTQVPERKQLHTFEKNPYSPRHNIYYVSQIVRAYKDPKSLARQHVHTSLQIMAFFQKGEKPSDEKIAPKRVKLPRRKGYEDKKTVVFDLDETLIHCNQNLEAPYDVRLPIVFPNGQVIEAGINIRPFAKDIIKNLSKNFQVIVFTASHSCYANVVIDYLDPEKQYIHHRLFREHCYATPEGMHVKDLRVIDRQLSEMVLVDNAAYSYIYQLDNGIPILPYYHGNTDFELKALQSYIQSMLLLKDMRSANKRTFKLHLYRSYYYDLQKLVEQLYLTEHNT